LQLITSEIFEDGFPLGRVLKLAQVRLEITRENSQCSGLSDTVGTYQTENLTWTRCGKSMELETIGSITMSHIISKTFRQVDDLNGLEGALFDAHTTTDAHVFTDEADLTSGCHFNAHFALFVEWAGPGTLLLAFFGFALVRVYDGDSELFVSFHCCRVSLC